MAGDDLLPQLEDPKVLIARSKAKREARAKEQQIGRAHV